MTARFVYRCYDADGQLLYIGCTVDVRRRMAAHRTSVHKRASRWLQVSMASYDVSGPYADQCAARRVEADAIADEQPLFNRQDRRRPISQTVSPVAEYLIDHGHLELALETACSCWQEDREAGLRSSWCAPHGHVADVAVAS